MRWMIGSSLQYRFLVLAIAATLMVFGIARLGKMPVDVLPEFAPPMVEIQTEAPGLSAAEVENLVTLDTEELLSGVSWLKTMRSQSVPGLASILMVFEPGTNLLKARQLIQERLTLAYALPNVAKRPVMLQPLSATSRTMIIAMSSKKLSQLELSVLARWTVKPRLMGVPGVANVAVWGHRERQLQVQVDPESLRAHGVTQEQIIRTTGDALWVSPLTFLNASFPGTGGWIDTPNQRLGVQHILPISTPEDLAKVPVDGAAALRLGDVATVVEGHPLVIGDGLHNGGHSLMLLVEKFPAANTLEVTRGVDAALEALKLGLPGVDIDAQVFRAATFIETAFANLTTALLLAAALVVLALGAFLYSWRSAVISLVAIPLSLLAATLVLYARGATFNTMVLAGFVIALALIVDDAIIAIDHIARRLRQRRQAGSDQSTATIVREAAFEVSSPLLYATLIVLLAVLPVFVMEGLSGAFFMPLAVSYTLAVVASLVVALTVTPALGLMLLAKAPAATGESPLVRRLQRGYDRKLSPTLHAPRAAFVTVVGLVAVGLALWPMLGQSLLPSFRERHLVIDWVGAPGASHPAMFRVMNQAARELRAVPGVRNVSAHLGRAETGDQVVGMNASQLWLTIEPQADYDATVAAVQAVVDGYPGLASHLGTYLRERVRQVLTGTPDAIVVRLYGPQRSTLFKSADEVKKALSGINGIVDLHVVGQVEEPQVEIKVDLVKAERHGIKPGDVRRQTATIVSGLAVGTLFEQQKVYDVVVWGVPEARHNLASLRDFMLETPTGGVRLGEVADVTMAPTPTVIHREAQSPRVDVVANVQGRDIGSVTREVSQRLKGVKFPLEYYPELLGEYVERQAAHKRMLGVAVAAAVGIFLLLQASFGSWRLAALVFLTVPMALVGGVLAAFAGGGISLGSLVGFLALIGIATRKAILLINHYQRLEQGGEAFGPELVRRGTRERVAPVLMTAVTTALALVPVVLFGNAAGLEIVRPMALVILGGLVTSTWLTLVVLPALYLRFGAGGRDVIVIDDAPSAASALKA